MQVSYWYLFLKSVCIRLDKCGEFTTTAAAHDFNSYRASDFVSRSFSLYHPHIGTNKVTIPSMNANTYSGIHTLAQTLRYTHIL